MRPDRQAPSMAKAEKRPLCAKDEEEDHQSRRRKKRGATRGEKGSRNHGTQVTHGKRRRRKKKGATRGEKGRERRASTRHSPPEGRAMRRERRRRVV